MAYSHKFLSNYASILM